MCWESIDFSLLIQVPCWERYLDQNQKKIQYNFTWSNEKGDCEIAERISASVFHTVLNHYKNDIINCPRDISVQDRRDTWNYLCINFNTTRC